MQENINLSEEETSLLRTQAEDRSRIYMFLSTLYMQRPEEEFVKKLKADQFIGNLKDALSGDEGEIKEGLRILELFVNSIKDIPTAEVAEDLAVDFTKLFREIKKGYGPPPPYESVWRGEGRIMGEWTQMVLNIYHDAGIGMDLKDEFSDYIGVELKFMSLLCYHEAEAWRYNYFPKALKFLNLEKRFLEEHLKDWVTEFCMTIAEEAKTSFYKSVAFLTKEFLEIDRRYIKEIPDIY